MNIIKILSMKKTEKILKLISMKIVEIKKEYDEINILHEKEVNPIKKYGYERRIDQKIDQITILEEVKIMIMDKY